MTEKLTPAGASPPAVPFTRGVATHPGLDRERVFGAMGEGIVVAFLVRDSGPERAKVGGEGDASDRPTQPAIGSWLHIGGDGVVTAYTGKVEVGQNIRTSLSQIVAEELRAPLAMIRLVMGDTDRTPYDIGTFSSLTIRVVGTQLRRVAAAARELLLRLAAAEWGVEIGSLTLAEGRLTHQETGRTRGLGELAGGRRLIECVSRTDAVTPAERWTVAGRPSPKVDGHACVTGVHRYASDLVIPGMLYGKILRPAAFRATLASVDTRAAAAMPGVTVIREGDFVGVTAPDEWTAARALNALEARWCTVVQPSRSEMVEYFRRNPVTVEGRGGSFIHTTGSLADGRAVAEATLEQTYTMAFVAHAPMEPRAALARWTDGDLTVWTATQRPFAVRSELAGAFGVAEHRVRVIVPDTGGAFGGKHSGDAAIEAARLARSVGRPVRVVWTRAEEFTWAYFRPAGVIDVASGAHGDGTLTAWAFHVYNAGSDAILTPYRVPNQHIEFHPVRSLLRQGAYRGLAATANHFARETHLDELACTLGVDPLELRRRNLEDPRLAAVLEAAANAFGWGRARSSPNHGFGIAGGVEKGGYVATCAEVVVDRPSGRVEVMRLVEAFECGAIINPDQLRGQVEGAVIQGLGGALFEAVEFENGRILNPDFSRYRVPRFADVPPIEVVLLNRTDLPPAGAGETPIVCVAPALGNAIFDATGIRLRSLPLLPHGTMIPAHRLPSSSPGASVVHTSRSTGRPPFRRG